MTTQRAPRPLGAAIGRGLLWGLLLAAIVTLILAAWSRRPGQQELPDFGAAPSFLLTDQRSAPFGSEELSGNPWIVDFIFTRCTLACPAMSRRMARLDSALPPTITLLSISIDPEHDRPKVLASYAEKLSASPRWHFLTGPSQDIATLVREGFKLAVDRNPDLPPGEAIVHSNRFVLVDSEGRVRGYYNSSSQEELARLESAARSLSR
ncbi:MAG: SCO family protein [Acidobacteriota bacterium]